MKVLYISNYGTMYGANKSMLRMICLLKEKYGVEPYVIASGGGPIIDLCEQNGITAFPYDFRISVVNEKIKNKNFRKLTRRVMRYKEFYFIAKRLEQQGLKFDLVHSNSSIFDIGLFLSRRWRIPHVWHVREFAKEHYGLESIFTRHEIYKKYKKSEAVVAISEAIKKKVTGYGIGISARTIYNGVPICDSYEKKYMQDGYMKFCIVGSISKGKRQLDVVKACHMLIREGISDFKLYIVGNTGGEYYREIQEYIQSNQDIADTIIFTGYCNNVPDFLKEMDVGIMASETEAFGRVTVEYMENYMPVIGTDSGGTPELLPSDGRLYHCGNVQELASQMEDLLKHIDKLEIEGNKLRERSYMFSAQTNAENIYRLYRSIGKHG